MADLGVTDTLGRDVDLEKAIEQHVELDENGEILKLNFDRWDKAAREKFQYGMIRAEGQEIQRTHIGELPTWLNRPMMALIFQFREMPLVAQNKRLGRAMAFADKEAVAGVVLNTAMAGMVRYAKFAALGLGVTAIAGNEWTEPTGEQMQIHKYIPEFGIFGDMYDFVLEGGRAEEDRGVFGTRVDDRAMREVPVLGLMKDYAGLAKPESKREAIDSAQGLLPLGNTAAGDMIFTWMQDKFGGE